MGDIHDALDKAIQNAELEKTKLPLKNVFEDQVIAEEGIHHPIDPDQLYPKDTLDKAIENAELEKIKSPSRVVSQDQVSADQIIRHPIDAGIMRQKRVVTLHNYNVESEAFRMLRTKILKQLRDNDWNSFAITAPTQGAGKTTVAVNLAIAMAMDVNQSVLLVDLDLKHPKVHWYFGLENEVGLRDYFLSDKPLSDMLINPGIDRLTILPGRGQAVGSSEILSGPRMKTLVNELNNRNQSRIIIFDLPPVLATDDVLSTIDCYDAILLVVEEGKNRPDEVKKTLKLLSGKNLLGTVLNKSQNPPEHQSY
ncbi:CpsD/CapB family tyrosine-protein kinase [Methyloglobulus sp.]|uniref:CpsD/CapB family tyrosine-protein kinase n=1 Tax=Methyloglobulus sp. TaxID=2518622 RepID=UPI0032B7EAEB